jgi:hypothetical protein
MSIIFANVTGVTVDPTGCSPARYGVKIPTATYVQLDGGAEWLRVSLFATPTDARLTVDVDGGEIRIRPADLRR